MINLNGRVFERLTNGGIGLAIPGAILTFMHRQSGSQKQVETSDSGTYSITLESTSYDVRVEHSDYNSYAANVNLVASQENNYFANFLLNPITPRLLRETARFDGIVLERGTDEPLDNAISGVVVAFISESLSDVRTTITKVDGTYSIELPQDNYIVTAVKNGYEPYSSEPDFLSLPAELTIFLTPALSSIKRANRFVFRGDRRFFNGRTTL